MYINKDGVTFHQYDVLSDLINSYSGEALLKNNSGSFTEVISDFIRDISQYFSKFPVCIELKNHPEVENLLKDIDGEVWAVPLVPSFVVTDTISVDFEKILIGSVHNKSILFEGTLYVNSNLPNAYVKKITLAPEQFHKGLSKEILEVAFNIILENLEEEKNKKLEMLKETGFGEF